MSSVVSLLGSHLCFIRVITVTAAQTGGKDVFEMSDGGTCVPQSGDQKCLFQQILVAFEPVSAKPEVQWRWPFCTFLTCQAVTMTFQPLRRGVVGP